MMAFLLRFCFVDIIQCYLSEEGQLQDWLSPSKPIMNTQPPNVYMEFQVDWVISFLATGCLWWLK